MEEIWKPVVGYEGWYEVSNLGRVKSIDRIIINSFGVSKTYYGKILKQSLERHGYVTVVLSKNSIFKRCAIHRLVALAFLPNPQNLPQVNHKDECKNNNNVENLEWCSCSYNVQYGSMKNRIGKARCRTVYRYSLNGELIDTFPSSTEVFRRLGFAQNSVSRACLKESKYKGFIWKYRKT